DQVSTLEQATLAKPATRHARSYLAALREGFRRGEQEIVSEQRVREIEADFARYLAAITDQRGHITLATGERVRKVPFSLHWLCDGDAFIGEASIRHQLNAHLRQEGGHIGYGIRPSRRGLGYGKRILALALLECRRLGIERVLVTCLDANVASAKIIEANGGRLESVIAAPSGHGPLRRYWIAP
ncbi:MAG: GNAT family N-acetyltransferase, partial [Geminicoccaceae bacterium]